MITSWQLYWILMLDNIKTSFIPISIITLIATLIFWILGTVLYSDPNNNPVDKKIGKILLILGVPSTFFLLICFLVDIFLPTTKQMALIYVIPKIATEQNIDKVQEECGELYNITKQWMKEQLEEQKIVEKTNDN